MRSLGEGCLSGPRPIVSVIIPSYNTRGLLAQCLASIGAGMCAGDGAPLAHETIVVDNGSTDGTAAMVALDFPAAGLIANPGNEGYARAMNRGARYASGRFLLASNADVVYPRGSIAGMVRWLESNPRTGIAGPQLIFPSGAWQRSHQIVPGVAGAVLDLLWLTTLKNTLYGLAWKRRPPARPRAVNVGYLAGAAMLIRRDAWDRVGGFDESFFFYAEDADLCHRVKAAGYNVSFLPHITVIHARGASSRLLGRAGAARLQLKAKLLFVRKHRGGRRAAVYRRLVHLYALERILFTKLCLLYLGKRCPRALIESHEHFHALYHASRAGMTEPEPGEGLA